MDEYRVIKQILQPFDNWNRVILFILQHKINETWYTLYASTMQADIKHTCQEGRNRELTMQAYDNFIKGV